MIERSTWNAPGYLESYLESYPGFGRLIRSCSAGWAL